MTKQQRAREFAHEMVEYWANANKPENLRGRDPFDLEWMLSGAWKSGFDSGQRHQVKIYKEKGK